jgi:hypothetical protein
MYTNIPVQKRYDVGDPRPDLLRDEDVTAVNQPLLQYYRCPESFVDFALTGRLSSNSGFFRFGKETLCFGKSCSRYPSSQIKPGLYDASSAVTFSGGSTLLPFNPSEIIENLYRERYSPDRSVDRRKFSERIIRNTYYALRPALPDALRELLQRFRLRRWEELSFPAWPVDCTVENLVQRLLGLSLRAQGIQRIPFIWFWPAGASSAAIMTHDVEQLDGLNFCTSLMDINDSAGIKASFQLVPEDRYPLSSAFLEAIRERGFEVNVHDLNHDGRLFMDRQTFLKRAQKINLYGKEFEALGFRSGALYRNLDWFEALDFAYDMSVPNVGHLDPQRGGCCTVMPYFLGDLLEIPVTTTQDYTLFHIFRDHSIDLWKRQTELIMEKHGIISFIVHPDYIDTPREQSVYRSLLSYLGDLKDKRGLWITTPGEVNRWWRARSQMTIVQGSTGWRIEGPDSERACIAYAALDESRMVYELPGTQVASLQCGF